MPELSPTKLFLKDMKVLEANQVIYKKMLKALSLLQDNPFHPGLRLERIVNDPSAWAVRVDQRYRISIDPEAYQRSSAPDWRAGIVLLRVLDHDDLYKRPR